MNQYVTGAIIKRLREGRGMTQAQLAQRLYVSEKTISKWETGKGLKKDVYYYCNRHGLFRTETG